MLDHREIHYARSTNRLPVMRIAVVAFAVLVAAHCGDDDAPAASTRWAATWTASPQNYNEVIPVPGVPQAQPRALKDKTLRQIVHTSIGGTGLRIKLSNSFGTTPLTVSDIRVARSTGGAQIDVSSERPVVFDQKTSVTVAAGAEAWSDATSWDLPTNVDLAISFYLPNETPIATFHGTGLQTNYIGSGSAVSAAGLDGAETVTSYYWLSGIDVMRPDTAKVIVAFGDSITDGAASTVSANERWPNLLDRRLQSSPSAGPVSVVNAGISGNRWLNDVIGPSGSTRFDRDVIRVSGATHAILVLGINDIGFSAFDPSQAVSADAMTASIASAVTKAKAAGLKVYLATLLPFKGATYYSDEAESKRQSVNAWIRATKTADGVIDFDAAMGEPSDPLTLRAVFDPGDHLHPNDAGYQAMADAIDLQLLR